LSGKRGAAQFPARARAEVEQAERRACGFLRAILWAILWMVVRGERSAAAHRGISHMDTRQPGEATEETTMLRNLPPPDQQRPGHLPAPDTAAMASPAPGPADLVHRRQLEKLVSLSGRERLTLPSPR